MGSRGGGKSVRDTVLVSDDTAFSDVICGMQEVKPAYWSPVFMADGKEVLSGSYYVLFCYSMVSIVLFLKEYVADRRNALAQQKKRSGFPRSICCAVSDPDRAVWRRGTGSDEISGGHDDEPRA